jgi:hypothetical protein
MLTEFTPTFWGGQGTEFTLLGQEQPLPDGQPPGRFPGPHAVETTLSRWFPGITSGLGSVGQTKQLVSVPQPAAPPHLAAMVHKGEVVIFGGVLLS